MKAEAGNSKGETVKVIVRVRPLSKKENDEKSGSVVKMDRELAKVTLSNPHEQNKTNFYTFDAVYDQDSKQ